MKQLFICFLITVTYIFSATARSASSDHICNIISIYDKRKVLTARLKELGHKGIDLEKLKQISAEGDDPVQSLDIKLKDTFTEFNSTLLVIEELYLEERGILNNMTLEIIEMNKLYNKSNDAYQKNALKSEIDRINECINSYEYKLRANGTAKRLM